MAKDPAVLFYTSDFISGTLTMTDEQRGRYILLLCLQHQKGYLTEKDMLNICKTYDEDIWVKALFNGEDYREISKYKKTVIFIPDVRFPNEVEAIQKRGGYIIRLTRCPYPEDIDESETALDEWQVEIEKSEGYKPCGPGWFRRKEIYLMNNAIMTIREQRTFSREIAKDILKQAGLFEE